MRARPSPSPRLCSSLHPLNPLHALHPPRRALRRLVAPLLPLLLLLPTACGTEEGARTQALAALPTTHSVDASDDYHGTLVADPYRWLEEPDSEATRTWIEQQNRATTAFLAAIPERAELRARLEALWNHPRFTAPERFGSWWFFRRNDGLQNQSVIVKAAAPGDPGEVLLDPNALSADGTTSVGAFVPTRDGRLAAYSLSHAGSDWLEWHVLDVETGAALPDVVPWSKFAPASWTHDNAGFYYTRYPAPAEGEAHEAVTEGPQVCCHRLGTPAANDAVVYARPDRPRLSLSAEVTDDGRYLVVRISEGTDRRNGIAVIDLAAPADRGARGFHPVPPSAIELLPLGEAAHGFVGADGTRFFFVTDRDAPRGRLIALDLAQPEPSHWTELIPHGADRIAAVELVGDRFVTTVLRDARHALRVHALDGALDLELALPDLGTVGGVTGRRADRHAFFTFETFTSPTAVLGWDLDLRELVQLRPPGLASGDGTGTGESTGSAAFVTRQVFYQSRDGTRVPRFIVHRQDWRLDGHSPTLLYGYGGFDSAMVPRFSPQTLAWLERGGVFAQACLRGGGEYGEDWHRAGMREHKQNVFDDFVAAAEYLIRNGHASPHTLAIWGRSNGGLLVGACLTQRPDLFGAAIPEVGVLDMLRYHRFTIGWAWAAEYGSSDDAALFPVLHAYSPLHRVQPGTSYPPVLVMTGDHDDRVLPGHSYKFAAALQQAQAGQADAAPILLRVETRAGHGASTPTAKQIDAAADRLAFLCWALRPR